MDITDGAEQLQGSYWTKAQERFSGGLSCHGPQYVSLVTDLMMLPQFLANEQKQVLSGQNETPLVQSPSLR